MHTQTISASDFKAKCLDIFDRLSTHVLDQVIITKRGKIVAVLSPPPSHADKVRTLHGFMRGSVVVPAAVDLTAPISDEAFGPESGDLHG